MMNRPLLWGLLAAALCIGLFVLTWPGNPLVSTRPSTAVVAPREITPVPESPGPTMIYDMDVGGYRLLAGRDAKEPGLTVFRGEKRRLRLFGGAFFLPGCDGEQEGVFTDEQSRYLLLGERQHQGRRETLWHLLRLSPRFKYVQHIPSGLDEDCPLVELGPNEPPSLWIDDITMCGFDSDSSQDCYLLFSVWYEFVGGEFRPDYSTLGEPLDWEYLREMASSLHLDRMAAGQMAPVEFWRVLLDLITEGHAREAREFAEDVWPEDRPGRAQALQAFFGRLRTSRHYQGLRRMNRGQMP